MKKNILIIMIIVAILAIGIGFDLYMGGYILNGQP